MMNVNLNSETVTRRDFLISAGLIGAAASDFSAFGAAIERESVTGSKPALIAISLDLEMSRNFPRWEDTHWDYEKGNLNAETKKYTTEACRRVKAHGGAVHCFVVGRVFEQENVDWLKEISQAGHSIGNHTYDHVNVKATKLEEIQF